MRRWRSVALAAVGCAVTGCGQVVESSTEVCFESATTSPDWVFELFLAGGLVALSAGLVWALLVFAKPTPLPVSGKSRRWVSHIGWIFPCSLLVLNVYNSRDLFHDPAEAYIAGGSLALIVLPLVGLIVAGRRYRKTGQWPGGRQAPWGFFWVLPSICVIAVGVAIWASVTMADSLQSTQVPC